MRILLKYTIKSMLEKKSRTFLIILAISLAGALFLASSQLSDSITRMYENNLRQEIGQVDVVVKPNNQSPSSFINPHLMSEVKESKVIPYVGGMGAYKVGVNTYENISINGYELEDYKAINKLSLVANSQVEPFTGPKIIVSEKAAKHYGLLVGESITLKINGVNRKLMIVGIAERQGIFAGEGNGYTSIMPMETLSEYRGGNGKPTALYVQLKEGISEEQLIGTLKSIYSRYDVEAVLDKAVFKESIAWMTDPFMLMTYMVIFMSCFIIYSSFKVIMLEKLPMMGTFRSIGASKRKMNQVLLLETCFYGVVGGLVAVILGIGILYILTWVMSSSYISGKVEMSITSISCLLTFVLANVIAFFSTLVPILSTNHISLKDIILNIKAHKSQKRFRSFLEGSGLIVFGFILGRMESPSIGTVYAVAALFLIIIGMIKILPLVILYSAEVLGIIFEKLFGNLGGLASKNIKKNKSVLNSITLITIGISILLMITTLTQNVSDQILDLFDGVFHFEVWVETGEMDEQKARNIQRNDGVYESLKFMEDFSVRVDELENREIAIEAYENDDLIRFKDYNLLGDAPQLLKQLQEGRYIIVSENLRKKFKLKVGDRLTLNFDKEKKHYEIIGFMDTIWENGRLCLLPMKYYKRDADKIYYDCIQVKVKKPEEEQQVVESLGSSFKDTWTNIYTTEDIKKWNQDSNASLMGMINAFAILAMLIGIIGVVNNLVISFIERQQSIAILRSIGMSKRQVLGMIFIEALGSGLIGAIGGIIGGILVMLNMDAVLSALNLPVKMEIIPQLFISYLVGGALITLIGSILPAKRSSKLQIIEAIKYE